MKILLLDPDPSIGRALERELNGIDLRAASQQSEGLSLVRSGRWDMILLDANFSDAGLELLPRIQRMAQAPVLFLAPLPSMDLTVKAIRAGAIDVMPKPLPLDRLRRLLETLPSGSRVSSLSITPRGEETLVGSSPAMVEVFTATARAANSSATVLILGESGTGKEMLARALHAQSPRSRAPFIAINCAAIPENLLESELFGHEKGAFTGAIGQRIGRFERADGGTLFLDEIGDMSLALQSKILRVLQEREVERVGGGSAVPIDVRVVAATNKDLMRAVQAYEFREDLLYRLAVIALRLPPLRARGADIDLLSEHFAALYAREHRRQIHSMAEETLEALRSHPWPGNVRQLRNAIERAVVMCSGSVLLPHHLPPDLFRASADGAQQEMPLCTLREMEAKMIERALAQANHNHTRAAELLGIHRNTLRRKLRERGEAS